MSVEIVSMGCRLNIAESEAMRTLLAQDDDLVIVNSCAVTNEAVRQTRQAIRRAKRARPDARVIVTGCAAQVEPEIFAAMPEVSRVVGNAEKFDPTSFALDSHPISFVPSVVEGRGSESEVRPSTSLGTNEHDSARAFVSDIMAVQAHAPHLAQAYADRTRAFVEVQNGCDHRCTFCIIPYGRGNSRSVPAGLVIDRIKALVDDGYQEVVLTGVDVTSYGPDLPGAPTLGMLVERILRHVPDLPRLRLSSLDSVEIDDRLEAVITSEPRFMPHLHMSFQSGDDMILKRMKRRHSRAQAVATVQRLKAKRPDIAIGADIIAGFPTETEAMFGNSMKLVEDCDIVMGHIFPYSPKSGTPAARMPQVEPGVIKDRARRLREVAAGRKAMWLERMIGTTQRVLVERSGTKGHAENFAPVQIAPPRSSRAQSRGETQAQQVRPSTSLGTNEVGKVVPVNIIAVENGALIGETV